MTLTIDLPEEEAFRFEAAAAGRGQDLHAFLIDAANELANADEGVDPEIMRALRLGLADIDAGRTLSLDEANRRFEDDLIAARVRLKATQINTQAE